ncbi:MAG: Ig-like domain-containing protein [Peptococcaceae bacterium]|jgi:uncharacterized protein YjdB|nr:Ig-like domain-containing protein [Peptococcaceae bacterium]
MPIGTPLSKNVEVQGKSSVFDSWKRRYVTGGVTLDHTAIDLDGENQRVIRAGEIVGRITATGLYAPWDKDASDGREVARGVAAQDTNCTGGDASIGICDVCRVHTARMPRQFTDAEWEAINASPYVEITRSDPYEVPGPKVISVAIAPPALALSAGGKAQLTAIFNPGNTVNQSGIWVSSNPAKAAVDTDGLVTASAAGTADITFKTQAGGVASAPCAVTVS